MGTQIQQRIAEHLRILDSFQLSEILDFMEFIHRKRKTILPDPNAIDILCGKYRDHLSTSEEFARRKQVEIELEEGKWRTK